MSENSWILNTHSTIRFVTAIILTSIFSASLILEELLVTICDIHTNRPVIPSKNVYVCLLLVGPATTHKNIIIRENYFLLKCQLGNYSSGIK